jgi:hypothetical protein
MRRRHGSGLLAAGLLLVLVGIGGAHAPKPAPPKGAPPKAAPGPDPKAIEAQRKAMEAQARALMDQQRKVSEHQRKAAETAVRAAMAAHQKAMEIAHKAAMEAARRNHEAQVHALHEAERRANEAREAAKRAATAQEKASLEVREREAKEAHARSVLAHREMEALEARQRRFATASEVVPMDLRVAVRLNQWPARQELAKELHRVRLLLERADHDYDGHRAAAVGHLGKAIGSLWPRNPFKDKDNGGNFEPQKLSDAQLGEAIQLLANDALLITEIQDAKVKDPAYEHVGNAIRELEIALMVR